MKKKCFRILKKQKQYINKLKIKRLLLIKKIMDMKKNDKKRELLPFEKILEKKEDELLDIECDLMIENDCFYMNIEWLLGCGDK